MIRCPVCIWRGLGKFAVLFLIFSSVYVFFVFHEETSRKWVTRKITSTITSGVTNKVTNNITSAITHSSSSINNVDHPKCKIPKMDPYDPEILPYINGQVHWEKCNNKRYGVVKKDKLILKVESVVSVFMFYIIRVDDFNDKLSEKVHLFGEDIVIPEVKSCWYSCGHKGGYCPTVCGENGYCCRSGYQWKKECPNTIPPGMMTSSTHSCIKPLQINQTADCDIEHQIKEDFFKLVIVFRSNHVHKEYHYAFLDKSKKFGIEKTKSQEQLNIMVVIIDSLSHSHAARSMNKTYQYLSNHPRTVIMRGHTIVGDGTTSQITAMLTGTPEKEQPEARRGFPNATFVDGWNFIYDDLHKRNYITTYSEEDSYGGLGTFHYRLKGFNKIPTTYFPRPLWRVMRDVVYQQFTCPHQFHLKYLRDYFDVHKDYKKFGVILSNVMHNDPYTVANVDEPTLEFLEGIQGSVHGDNTVVIVMGDHGLRTSGFRATLTGKLEERLPLLSITYPRKLEVYNKEINNLRENSRVLTSHFDLYNTLQHISTFPDINEQVHTHKYGRSLFSNISMINRTCAHAGVDNHWCPCMQFEKVDATRDKNVGQLLEKVLKFINERNEATAPGKCQVLKLKGVTRAGRHAPNTQVSQFKRTSTNKGECDSCHVEYDKNRNASRFSYEVAFVVYPETLEMTNDSRYLPAYEAGGDILLGSLRPDIKVDTAISRINRYGKQPDCIAATFPHLRAFCFCKDFKLP